MQVKRHLLPFHGTVQYVGSVIQGIFVKRRTEYCRSGFVIGWFATVRLSSGLWILWEGFASYWTLRLLVYSNLPLCRVMKGSGGNGCLDSCVLNFGVTWRRMAVFTELEAGSSTFYEGRPRQKFRRCRESNRSRPAYNHVLYCTKSGAMFLPCFLEIVW